MASGQSSLRKQYSAFFKQVYARGTQTRAILEAARPNTSEKWNAPGDIKRGKAYARDFAKETLRAIDRLAVRN